MTKERRNWFLQKTGTSSKRGKRFFTGDRPDLNTYTKLVNSVLYSTETSDRAKEEDGTTDLQDLNGHVVASTDAQAKALQEKVGDRTYSVQPSQLPEVLQELQSIGNITDEALVSVTIETGGADSDKRNRYIVKLSDELITYLSGLGSGSGGIKIDDVDTVLSNKLEDKLLPSDFIDLALVITDGGQPNESRQFRVTLNLPVISIYIDNTNSRAGDGTVVNPFNNFTRALQYLRGELGNTAITNRVSIFVAKGQGQYIVAENLWYNVDWYFEDFTELQYNTGGYIFDQDTAVSSGTLTPDKFAPNVFGEVKINCTTNGLLFRSKRMLVGEGPNSKEERIININSFTTIYTGSNPIILIDSYDDINKSFKYNFTSNSPTRAKFLRNSSNRADDDDIFPFLVATSRATDKHALFTLNNIEFQDVTPFDTFTEFPLSGYTCISINSPLEVEILNCKFKNYLNKEDIDNPPNFLKGSSMCIVGTIKSIKIDNCEFEPLSDKEYTGIGIGIDSQVIENSVPNWTVKTSTSGPLSNYDRPGDIIITNNKFISSAGKMTLFDAVRVNLNTATSFEIRCLQAKAFNNNIIEGTVTCEGTTGTQSYPTDKGGIAVILQDKINNDGTESNDGVYFSGGYNIFDNRPSLIGSALLLN